MCTNASAALEHHGALSLHLLGCNNNAFGSLSMSGMQDSHYGVPAIWVRAVQASERSVDALQRMEMAATAADQNMMDELAPLQSQLDRLLILQHELAQRKGALRQSHKTLLIERNVYLRKLVALEELVSEPEQIISPDRTEEGRMADTKLLSVVDAVLSTSKKVAESRGSDYRPPRRGHSIQDPEET